MDRNITNGRRFSTYEPPIGAPLIAGALRFITFQSCGPASAPERGELTPLLTPEVCPLGEMG